MLIFALLLQCVNVAGQTLTVEGAAAWEISGNREYNAHLDRTIFSYRVSAYNNGKVTNFAAGIPSCPEIQLGGGATYQRESITGLRGVLFANDVNPTRSWTYTVVLQGMIEAGTIPYVLEGYRYRGVDKKTTGHNEFSKGTVIGPKCQTVPKVICDAGQERYVGKCVGDTVRVALFSKSKYYTSLEWSTGYPGCSFSAVDTSTPFIVFHGPICDIEFKLTLDVWGPNKQHEVCTTLVTVTDNTPPSFSGIYGPQDVTSSCDDIPSPLHIVARDTCDNDVQVSYYETEEEFQYHQKIIRVWVATDDCENTVSYQQVVVVQDTVVPKLIGVPKDETYSCGVDIEPCVVVAIDDCDEVSVVHTEEVIEGTCLDSWSIIRSWFAEDSSHNEVREYQTVLVVDNEAPALVGIPEDLTVDCNEVPGNIVPTAHDNCQDYVAVSSTENSVPGQCPNDYSIYRKYSAFDECGNHAEALWVITVVDNKPPELSSISSYEETVPCDVVPAPCVVEMLDDCAAESVTLEPEITKSDEVCEGTYTLTYTWVAEDECGNQNDATKVLNVVDNVPPYFTSRIPTQLRATCVHLSAPLMRVADNCSPVTMETIDERRDYLREYGQVCDYNYILYREWVATDECGLKTTVTQTVTVSDGAPPVLVGAPPDMTVSCDGDLNFQNIKVTAIDDCCVGEPKFSGKIDKWGDECAYTYKTVNKWRVEDCCGHVVEHLQTVQVYDDVPPRLIGVPGSRYIEIQHLPSLPAHDVTVEDNCDPIVTVEYDSATHPGSCPHNYQTIKTFSAVDDCGNKAVAQTTIWCDDHTPPDYDEPNYVSAVECPRPTILPLITVTDNVGGYLVDLKEVEVIEEGTCEDTYDILRHFTATDPCGNVAEKTYTVRVWDTTPPEWKTLPCQTEVYQVFDTFAAYSGLCENDVKAYDLCAGEIDVVVEEETKLGSCETEYVILRKFTATDNCGNAISLSRTTDVQDQTPPTLTNVPVDITIECTDDYELSYDEPVADDYGYVGTLSTVTDLRRIGGACESNFTVHKCWTTYDCVGHHVTACQTITVRDTTPPSFAYLPPDTTLPCDAVDEPAVVHAADDCGPAVVVPYEKRESGTCNENYEIFRTWRATDECNHVIEYTQTVTVIDEGPPSFDYVPASETLPCGTYSRYVAATCVDDCDNKVEVTRGSSKIKGTCDDSHTDIRSWTCQDNCGNTREASQSITFLDDTPPTFNYKPFDLSLPCVMGRSVIPNAPRSIRANDDCDNQVTPEFNEFIKEGSYGDQSSTNIRVWTATDNCGNTAEQQQTIIVYDDVPPSVKVPKSEEYICTETPPIPTFDSVSDNCDPEPVVTVERTTPYQQCYDTYTLEYTWTPCDKSGNCGQPRSMRIVVDDSIPPSWVGDLPPVYSTVSYVDGYIPPTLTASDECDASPRIERTEVITEGECPLEQTVAYYWTATDRCGNFVSFELTVNIVDNVAPPLSPLPPDTTLPCPSDFPEAAVLISNDEYAYEKMPIVFSERVESGSCEHEKSVIRKWVVVDCAGNTKEHIQTIKIIDDAPPVLPRLEDKTFECAPDDYTALQAFDECDAYVEVDFREEDVFEGCVNRTIYRYWTATDSCGNKDSSEQKIVITDHEDPLMYGNPLDVVVDNHNVPGISYALTCSDACQADEWNADYSPSRKNGTCPDEWEEYRKWTCTDECGHSVSYTQTVHVVDNEQPILDFCPSDITVQLGFEPVAPTITATDAQVYDEVTVKFVEEEIIEYRADLQKRIFRKWTAVDNCKNKIKCEQTITVIDTVPPIIPDVPRDIVCDCDDILITEWEDSYRLVSEKLIASVYDVGTVTITPGPNGPFDFVKIPGTCKGEFSVKRTWTATDHAGNSLSDTQVITVIDDYAPQFTTKVKPSLNFPCVHEDAPTVEITDNCDPYVFPQFHEDLNRGYCPYEYSIYREWTAVDSCGNENKMVQTVYVYDDEKPTLSPIPLENLGEHACDDLDNLPKPPTVTCTDNCLGEYAATLTTEKLPGTCEDSWLMVRKWTCKDACYGEAHAVQSITIVDKDEPVFEYSTTPDIVIECDESVPVISVSASDNCADVVSIHEHEVGSIVDYSRMEFQQVWTATDNCGNRKDKTRVIKVVDSHPPVIDTYPHDVTLACDQYPSYLMPEPHCTDNCGVPTLTRDIIREVGTCEQEYELITTWTCVDQHDLETVMKMTVTVVDNVPPTMEVKNVERRIPCTDTIAPVPNVNAYDNCDDVSILFDQSLTYAGYLQGTASDPVDFSNIQVQDGYYISDATNNGFTWYPVSPVTTQVKAFKVMKRPVKSTADCLFRCDFFTGCVGGQVYAPVPGGQLYCYLYNLDQMCEVQKYAYQVPVTQSSVTDIGIGRFFMKDYALCVFVPEPYHLCDDYTVSRTWASEDECGNKIKRTQRFTVYDDQPPVFGFVPSDQTLDCTVSEYLEVETSDDNKDWESVNHGISSPNAVDDCGTTTIEEDFVVDKGDCDMNVKYYITWTATDDCGNSVVARMTLTKWDITPPEMAYVVPEVDQECLEQLPPPTTPICEDDCSSPTVAITTHQSSGICKYDLVYLWTCTDECGNAATASQTLHVADTEPPVMSATPEDSTLDCAEEATIVDPTIDEECGEYPRLNRHETNVVLDCPQNTLHIVSWTASDDCGNKKTAATTVTYQDTTPPSILHTPSSETVECESTYVNPGVIATDDCGEAYLSFTESTNEYDCASTGIYFEVYRTWIAKDLCGLVTVETATITVVDKFSPEIIIPPDANIPCDSEIPNLNVIASDDCGEVTLDTTPVTVAGTCEDQYNVVTTFTAVDRCGNVYYADHTTFVVDTQKPELTGVPSNRECSCHEIPAAPVVQVKDDCSNPEPHFDEVSTRDGYSGEEYEIIRCWWVADDCGNRDDQCYTLTVVDDQPPTLLCAGMSKCDDISLECAIYPPLPPITVKDNCYEHLEIKYDAHGEDGSCIHDQKEIREWTTHDGAGGTATLTQTVTYYDHTPPELDGYTSDITAQCNDEVAIPPVSANDNCDYALTVDYTFDIEGMYCKNLYVEIRKWTATDICGNSDWRTQTVTVVDTNPPIMSIYSAHATVECDQVASVWPGEVSAADDCDYNIVVKFTEERKDGSCPDKYTLVRVWRAEDCVGNVESHVQNVVVVDTIPPYFLSGAPADVTMSQEEVYSGEATLDDPYGITAADNCVDPSVKYEEVTLPLGYDCEYMYYRIRTWSIHDDCGNTDQYQQTIDMVYTKVPELDQPDDITVECDSVPPPCNVELIGNNGYDVTVTFTEETEVGICDDEYTLIRTWTAVDCAYNTGSSVQTVTVVDDSPPVLTRYPEDEEVDCDCDPLDGVPDVDAVDNCDLDGEDVVFSQVTTAGTCDHTYTITRTWDAKDSCGNIVNHVQVLSVVDTEPPLFCDDFCDEDVDTEPETYECDYIPVIEDPLVKDDCDPEPEVLQVLVPNVDDLQCENDLIYKWSATDDCGNEGECEKIINVLDETAPTCVDCNRFCYPLTDYGEPEAYIVYDSSVMIDAIDNCADDDDVTITLVNCTGDHVLNFGSSFDDEYCVFFSQINRLYIKVEAVSDTQGRDYNVMFLLEDACGNTRHVSKKVWIPDNRYTYADALSSGNCNGLGPAEFKDRLPQFGR